MTRLSDEPEAVSPVIGTILMVAVTVVLAGVVFAVATQFGKVRDSPPEMAFVRDEQADRLLITTIVTGVAVRGEYQIRMSHPGDFDIDSQVGAGADVAPVANTFVGLAGAMGGRRMANSSLAATSPSAQRPERSGQVGMADPRPTVSSSSFAMSRAIPSSGRKLS